MSTIAKIPATSYTLTAELALPFEQAVPEVVAALAANGFGVLTKIDIQATLKKKLDADTRPYLILGACSPPLAHQALVAEPAIGALLPCNVVVAANDSGGVTVSAIDPVAMFGVVGRADIEPLAIEVRKRLQAALDAAAT